MDIRIGNGFDVHAFCKDRKLILGGISIPYEKGLLGHSDADVLLHAMSDCLLGSLALGDIGKYYPDNDSKYKNMSSILMLKEIYAKIKSMGYKVVNIDSTILCEKPKLLPYINSMKENIAPILGIATTNISIKATTTEGLGFVGRIEGIGAISSCLVCKDK